MQGAVIQFKYCAQLKMKNVVFIFSPGAAQAARRDGTSSLLLVY